MSVIDMPIYSAPDEQLTRRLPPVARAIFTETFGHLYESAPFEAFCDDVYGPGGSMEAALADPAIYWRVASIGGDPIGYAKLRPLAAPAPAPLPGAMELQQIYVRHEWHSTGIAEELMRWAIATAQECGAPELYLTVFDHNERAKRFYARHGFVDVGRCTFTLGERTDEDRVWRRDMGLAAGED
jgi:GNAT superfamily N-acetyltransferase